jgi:hypothetical protein
LAVMPATSRERQLFEVLGLVLGRIAPKHCRKVDSMRRIITLLITKL